MDDGINCEMMDCGYHMYTEDRRSQARIIRGFHEKIVLVNYESRID